MGEMALVVISHGDFGKGAMQSAEMILGPQSNIRVISLTPEKGREDLVEELRTCLKELDTSQGVMLLTDVKSGTTTNAAAVLVMERKNVHLCCGYNLPVLLEYLQNRDQDFDTILEAMQECHQASFCDLGSLLRKEV
jgi:PTS system mannose-specific IIA component